MIEILVYPADEVNKEIDGLMDNFKEMELQKDEKIERLEKENEWILNEAVSIYCTKNDQQSEKTRLIEKMQQVLKGKV